MRRLVFLLFGCAALAADLGPELLKASRKGQAEKAQSLAARGAPVESRDKNGRTALMLAAERGHAAVVKVLLSRGAKTDARDREGWTAYGLALFSGETGRAEVLKLLPAPPRGRITLEIEWGSENLYSSCFLSPAQLRSMWAPFTRTPVSLPRWEKPRAFPPGGCWRLPETRTQTRC